MRDETTPGFDVHTHLDFPVFDPDRAAVCARAREAGVGGWAIAAAEIEDWARVTRVAEETGGVAMLGVHPWYVPETDVALDAALHVLAAWPGLTALGETGLDHGRCRDDAGRARQRDALRRHLALARERDLPVALHCVRAHAALIDVLRADGAPAAGWLVHGWTGPAAAAQALVDLGGHVSFGPMVLRAAARKCRESAAVVPLDRLLVETDCPDRPVPGVPRGEPAHAALVAAELAALRGLDAHDVLRQTGHNARRLLRAG